MSTDIAANKRLVERYFDRQRAGDMLGALDFMADGATWTVPGDWEMAGVFSKADLAKMLGELNQFAGGLEFAHHSVTAEENRVAVLTEVTGTLKDGRIYTNTIFFLFVVEGDKFSAVIEAPDSAKSRKFWLGL